MRHQLLVQARQRPEVLERILRVVRHRGFQIISMNMTQEQGNKIQLQLTVESERPLYLLAYQIDKLVDVEYVDCLFETSQFQNSQFQTSQRIA